MKKTSAKIMSALMIAAALLGFASVFHAKVAYALPPPLLFVDPASNIFPPPSMTVGSIFTVNVTVANVTGLAGIQYTLTWDPLLLQCLSQVERFFNDPLITKPDDIPPASPTYNIWKVKNVINPGNCSYAYTWQTMSQAQANGYAPANVTADGRGSAYGIPAYVWPEGKHAAATITFKVLRTPTKVEGNVNCTLHLTITKFGDIAAGTIPHTDVDGYYQLNYQLPTTLPYFSVVPSTYTAHSVGEEFNISVWVNNLDAGWEAVGFQFSLNYNSTLLLYEGASEGTWLPPFGAPPNQGTLFMKSNGSDYVSVGDVVLPDTGGHWHSPFPSGSGPLAVITFKALLQNVYPAPDLTCPLHLYDTLIADWTPTKIGQTAPQDGTYIMKSVFVSTGRNIDIFTQWVYPYGGQGPDQNSDMFWPQKEICLYANVTYNGWPEQQKDVAFSIQAPDGTVWGIIYARTNASGIASTTIRLPWPCDHPEQWFGVWTITGTVDIACVIVNDTLHFHYDYLVRIWKVTVDQTSYNHVGNANATTTTITACITFGTYLWQDTIHYVDQNTGFVFDLQNFTVAVTAIDNLSVPFGYVYTQVPISALSNGQPWHYCEYRNITVCVQIPVPKFTAAGPGELDTAILDNWPFLGGTVQSGYLLIPPPDFGTWLPYCPTPIIINAA